jgi:hypothetical protein
VATRGSAGAGRRQEAREKETARLVWLLVLLQFSAAGSGGNRRRSSRRVIACCRLPAAKGLPVGFAKRLEFF